MQTKPIAANTKVVTERAKRRTPAPVLRTATSLMLIVATIATILTLSASPAAAATTQYCGGKAATIIMGPGQVVAYGTKGDDVIVGNELDNVIYGYKGNDRICGRGGDDVLRGGKNADHLYGGDGDDKLYGEKGWRDRLHGGNGWDFGHGGKGWYDECYDVEKSKSCIRWREWAAKLAEALGQIEVEIEVEIELPEASTVTTPPILSEAACGPSATNLRSCSL